MLYYTYGTMVKIQKKKNQYSVTIPIETVKFTGLEGSEEVFVIPNENMDILIKRKKKE